MKDYEDDLAECEQKPTVKAKDKCKRDAEYALGNCNAREHLKDDPGPATTGHKSNTRAFGKGAYDGGCVGVVTCVDTILFLGAFNLDNVPYDRKWLFDPSDPELNDSKVGGQVAAACLAGRVGVALTKLRLYRIKCALHAPHTGGPHRYWHFQITRYWQGIKKSHKIVRIPLRFLDKIIH